MDHAAVCLMREFPEIILGFGQSDEFRYVYLIPIHANPAINLPSVFSFENPRYSTTDADQKLRRFCALFSRPRTS